MLGLGDRHRKTDWRGASDFFHRNANALAQGEYLPIVRHLCRNETAQDQV